MTNDHHDETHLSDAELDLLRALDAEYAASSAGGPDWVRFKQFWW